MSGGPEAGLALEVRGLVIAFEGGAPVLELHALSVAAGEIVAIEGPSGAGKSSLLLALAGLERPASGEVVWGGELLWGLPTAARERWRRERLGLVFQDMHLLDGLSALENVLLPLAFDHLRRPPGAEADGLALLERLGIGTPGRRTGLMSRGERQRVAIARALLRRPAVLLADEPTASLDQATAMSVFGLLLGAAAEAGATLLVATHDPALLARVPRRLRLQAGRLAA